MKNIKAISSMITAAVKGIGEIGAFSRRLITAAMAVALAVQLAGCALLIFIKLSGSTYSAQTIYNITELAGGMYNSGFRFIVIGFGSAFIADIVFRSYGSE